MLLSLISPAVCATEYAFTTLAGPSRGGNGWVDGSFQEAQFNSPQGMAADSQGNLYVADSGNHTIRKLVTDGQVTTVAGMPGQSGQVDGYGGWARLNSPRAIAAGADGTLYVADSGNHVIRVISPAGFVSTLAGAPGESGWADGLGAAARFNEPEGIAIDAAGNVLVADTQNHVIRRITPGGEVTTLAGLAGVTGTGNGAGTNARFNGPKGMVFDMDGALLVVDHNNHCVRRVTPEGEVRTAAGRPGQPGSADSRERPTLSTFRYPNQIAVDADGNLFISEDARNGQGAVRSIAAANQVTFTLVVFPALRTHPEGLALGPQGTLAVAAKSTDLIYAVKNEGDFSVLAGAEPPSGDADGPWDQARFDGPEGVAADVHGNVFVTEYGGNRVRKITAGGDVSTVVPAGLLQGPTDVAVDPDDVLYVVDHRHHQIIRVSPVGEAAVLAGGQQGSQDGTGAAARFNTPAGVAVDSIGNLYVTDMMNFTIRRISPEAEVTTIAGMAGESGAVDGPGPEARFSSPFGIAVAEDGTLYITERNHYTLRKIAPDGMVTLVAGKHGERAVQDGTGPDARFYWPQGVVVSPSGLIFVADRGGGVLRTVTPEGQVRTIAGQPFREMNMAGIGANAGFSGPASLAFDSAGNLCVTDFYNHSVRRGTPAAPDRPIADLITGAAGRTRQLEIADATASEFAWQMLRRPAGSAAELSSNTVRNPTFTPDVPDVYTFQLSTTNEVGQVAIRLLDIMAEAPTDDRFGFVSVERVGERVVLEVFGLSGHRYVLEYTGSPGTGAAWETLQETTLDGERITVTDTPEPGVRTRFYRLRSAS